MFKHILRSWQSRSFNRPGQKCRPNTCRPRMEVLEDRIAPALYIVNALTDSASGSGGLGTGNSGDLRYCITQANKSAGGNNTILFGESGMLTLSAALPPLADNLTITVPQNGSVTINGNSFGSVFTIGANETVSLAYLTITGGNSASGGGIFNDGNLSMSYCTISGNSSGTSTGNFGGGILNLATATVSNSTISGNSSSGAGGGIFNNGTMTINNSIISNNTVPNSNNGGGGIYNQSTLTVTGSTISYNTTSGNGGGFYNTSGTTTINGSTISFNSSTKSGGGINNNSGGLTISNCTFSNNSTSASGGCIYVNSGTLALSNSTLSNSTASSATSLGGAIANVGTATIANSTFSGNTATAIGGGIANNGTMTVTDSTINGNTGTGGGGGIINLTNGVLAVNESTMTGNNAGGGGAIVNVGTLAVIASTISGNTVTGSGNVGGGIQQYSGKITLQDTIVAGNTTSASATDPDFAGTVNPSVAIGGVTYNEGYNLIGNNTGSTGFTNGVNGDQVGTSGSPINPDLGSFQNNGGPTATMALLSNSPAVNAGNPNGSGMPAYDQRGPGFPRIVGGRVDIGAYESAYLPSPSQLVFDSAPTTVAAGQTFNFQIDVEDSHGNLVTTDSSTLTATLTGPGSFTGGSATVQASGGIADFIGISVQVAGSYTLQIGDTGDGLSTISTTFTVTAGSPAILSVNSGSGQSVTVGTAYANLVAKLTDAYGNPISGTNVTFSAPSSGASVSLGTNPATTNASGLATITATTNTTAGAFTVTAADGNLSTSFQLTNKPGSPQKLVFIDPPPSTNSVVAGQAMSTFEVAIEDSDSNVVTSDNHAVSVTLVDDGFTLSGTTTVNASSGIAMFSGLSTWLAVANDLLASDPSDGVSVIETPITVNPGSPAILSASSGSGQSVTVGTPYSALFAELTDAYGNPISGANVTFTAPSSGASVSLGTPNPAKTTSNGLVAISATANTTAGAFTVNAAVDGSLTGLSSLTTSFQLTNEPGSPSKLVLIDAPANGTAGDALSNFEVAIEDGSGNVVTSDSNAVTISLATGSLAGATTVNAVNGIASFSGLITQLAGSNTLQASDSTDSLSKTATITINPNSPAILSVNSGSGQSVTVSTNYANLVAKLTDAYGNPISGASVTFSAPGNGASVTLGTNPATTNAGGLATISATADATAGVFDVAAAASGLSTTFVLTNNPGAANKLVFIDTPPSTNTATAGQALSNFEVGIEDSNGNVVTSDSNAVSISLSSGAMTGSTTVNAVAGFASFSGLVTQLAGADSLQASDAADSLTKISTPITINAGSPAILSVSSGSGQGVTVGNSFAPLVAKLSDAYGNPITGASVTFTAATSGASITLGTNPVTTNASGLATISATANTTAGSFIVIAATGSLSTTFALTDNPGTANKLVFIDTPPSTNAATAGQALSSFQVAIEDGNGNVVTSDSNAVTVSLATGLLTGTTTVNAVAGIASFSGLVTQLAGANNLQANDAADSLTKISTPITIDAGTPAILSVSSGTGQSATVGNSFAPLVAKLTDAYGNPISGASVTFAAPTSGASVTLGTNPATTNASGLASISAIANTTAGGFSVNAASNGLSTTFQLTNNPGTANKLVFINAPSNTNTVMAGLALSSFQVAIEDSNGNVVTSDSNPITISLGSGTLTGTTTVDAVDGIAAFSGLTTDLAGLNTLEANDSTDTQTSQISTAITINPGSPAILSVHSGSGQSETVGNAYAPLVVLLTDAYGNPISGGPVTYTAPANGASVTFSGGNTATTSTSGIASIATTANTSAGGPFTITASADHLSTSFQLTNTPETADKLVFIDAPASTNTVAAGETLSNFQVAIEDSDGNLITSDSSAVTVSLSTGTLTGTTSVHAIDGIASFNGLTTDLAGLNTLEASDSTDTRTSQISTAITINPGSPAILSVHSGSGQSETVGNAYSPLTVLLTDAYGNPVGGASVTFTAPASGASVTLGTNPAITNASGLASISGTANTTAGGFTINAVSNGLFTTFQETNTPGTANKLVFIDTPPSTNTGMAGQPLSNFQVAIEDSNGNVVTSDSNAVSISLSSGALTGTTTVDAVAGIASFSGLVTQLAGANNLQASDAADSLATISTPIEIVTTNQAILLTVVSGSGQSTPAGAAFGMPLQVQLTDPLGNPVPGAIVTFTAPNSGITGNFSSNSNATVVTNAQGVAVAPTLSAGTKAGSFTVTAMSGNFSAKFDLTNTAAAPTNIFVEGGGGQNTILSTSFAQPLQVLVTDEYGNPVSGNSVSFNVPGVGPSGTFNASSTVLTNSQGIATSPTLTANAVTGNFSVTALAAGVTAPATFGLTVTGVPSSIAVFKGSGQSAHVDTAFASPLEALVLGSNKKPIAGITVVFKAPGNGVGGVFAGSVDAVTNASGIAVAPQLIADTTVGTFKVLASVGDVAKPASFTVTNTAATAVLVSAVAGSSQSAAAGKIYSRPLQALVQDTFGNPVAGVTVTFTAPTSGASGTFGKKSTIAAVTNSSGIATAPAFLANTITGSFSVSAAIAGGASTSFNLSNVSTAPGKATANGGSQQNTSVGLPFSAHLQVLVSTSKGQPVSGVWVTFTAPTVGASALFNGSNTVSVQTNSSGIATAPTLTANTVAGFFTVTAAVSGVPTSVFFGLANLPGQPAAVRVAAGNNQSLGLGSPVAIPLVAIVTDAYGNTINGVAVTLTVEPNAGAGGTFSGGQTSVTISTNGNGLAIAPVVTANDTVGVFTVDASISGVAQDAVFTLTNL